MAYLRVFIEWEALLEETFVRLMCAYELPAYQPQLKPPHAPFTTVADARNALYGGRDFLLWHNPGAVIKRCRKWFSNGIHDQVLSSNFARLEWFAKIRHRIAHSSDQVKREMDLASVQLAGRRYSGASAGRFLRDWKRDNPLVQERWLWVVANELRGIAGQLAP